MAQTLVGTNEAGGGKETTLATATAAVIRAYKTSRDREARRMAVYAAATGDFRLNYFFTPDEGTTWYIGKQVASSAVTVDGGTASYLDSATLDLPIGYAYKVELYNATVGNIDYTFDYREYTQ